MSRRERCKQSSGAGTLGRSPRPSSCEISVSHRSRVMQPQPVLASLVSFNQRLLRLRGFREPVERHRRIQLIHALIGSCGIVKVGAPAFANGGDHGFDNFRILAQIVAAGGHHCVVGSNPVAEIGNTCASAPWRLAFKYSEVTKPAASNFGSRRKALISPPGEGTTFTLSKPYFFSSNSRVRAGPVRWRAVPLFSKDVGDGRPCLATREP